MGLDSYVARNDRGTLVDGVRLGDLATVEHVPVGLPDAVRRTVELIDVVWLRRNTYVAAFEIESTTRIFTGLLRMGDLIAQLPNYDIPLFIVAPEARRGAVFEELSRPLFSMGLQRPLDQIVRFIASEGLETDIAHHGRRIRLFDPRRYLDELSEPSPHRVED